MLALVSQSPPGALALFAQLVEAVLLYLFLGLLPLCAVIYAIYFLLTLPMRRNQRARLFLDLLELGLNEGHTPEHAILDAAASRDASPGARFHLLAAYLEKGMKFSEALRKVPRLLPPQLLAMFKAGERIGDIRKVLPACRHLLGDGVSQVRGALNYMIILAFVVTPFTILMPILINVFILPKFREVFAGMLGGQPMPAFTRFVFGNSHELIGFEVGILSLVWIALVAYVGGPRVRGWIERLLPGLPDRVLYAFPWRRKRLQRDFSAMLAVLLDAGAPEPEAVALAAESTSNGVMRRRAAKVCALLNSGVKLPVAIRQMDDAGELHWRLANALRRERGFLRTLTGWHDALDARAFQSEQVAAQITTSVLVLFNGLIVACLVISIFLVLVSLLNGAVLW